MSYKGIVETGAPNILLVSSEPGDATRYNYFVFRNGPDTFHFMPCDNTFRYPQILDYWEVRGFESEVNTDQTVELIKLADKHNCNPHTLTECIRTIKELHDE